MRYSFPDVFSIAFAGTQYQQQLVALFYDLGIYQPNTRFDLKIKVAEVGAPEEM